MRRRPGAVLVATALLTALGVGAHAHWPAGGTGSGSAGSATAVDPVTLSSGAPAAGLHPGGTAAVVVTVTNPNPAEIRVGSLDLDTGQGTGGYTVDAGHPGCPPSVLTYTTQDNGGSGWDVPRRVGAVDGSVVLTLPGSLAMSPTAPNACQGAAFTVHLAVAP